MKTDEHENDLRGQIDATDDKGQKAALSNDLADAMAKRHQDQSGLDEEQRARLVAETLAKSTR